jgi:hypothetical protein
MLRKHTYFDELAQNKRAFAAASAATASSLANNPSSYASLSPATATAAAAAREHVFDKTDTPSDVGKLNRLVIPKQHAEKHFPLQLPSAGGESKGRQQLILLLNAVCKSDLRHSPIKEEELSAAREILGARRINRAEEKERSERRDN